jgi:hypothetical protein
MRFSFRSIVLAGGILIFAGCAFSSSPTGAEPSQDTSNRPTVAIPLPSQAPAGAVLLFTGKPEQLKENWIQRYTTNPAGWTVDSAGVATPQKSDIATKQEFGDCYVHVEFRTPLDANGKLIGMGNAGIGLQGRYEIQMMSSYGRPNRANGNASMYSQKAPLVNVSKKPGEWESFDIIFRAPRFDAGGQVTEKPRATVFHNGVLVHNNEDFTGMTGIQYDQYKEMAKTGPIILQGDHDPVQYRNIWLVPL